jgi:uncharacterized membrane protein HdeD (DUF308 family)
MSESRSVGASLATSLDNIHDSWGWFVALGVALIILGVVCITGNITATFATVLALGWLLMIGGLVSLVQAFRTRSWNAAWPYLLSALLRGFTGYLLVRYPMPAEVSLTLLLATLFIVGGIFRAIAAGTLRFPRWGWPVASGIISVVLGIMLLAQLPTSSVWFIGFAIGVDFVLDGSAFIALGNAVRSVPAPRSVARA